MAYWFLPIFPKKLCFISFTLTKRVNKGSRQCPFRKIWAKFFLLPAVKESIRLLLTFENSWNTATMHMLKQMHSSKQTHIWLFSTCQRAQTCSHAWNCPALSNTCPQSNAIMELNKQKTFSVCCVELCLLLRTSYFTILRVTLAISPKIYNGNFYSVLRTIAGLWNNRSWVKSYLVRPCFLFLTVHWLSNDSQKKETTRIK